MIRLSNLSQSYKGKEIFNNLDWSIKKNRKYGLIGPNGTGKTTLLEALSGRLEPESGEINMPKKVVLGYLPQDMHYEISERSVVDEALSVLSGHADYDESNSDSIRYKAEKILSGLGFTNRQLDERADTMSGGWKMRIELAKILLKEPNVLLLDEPTNHLDIQSIQWIEDYLNTFKGTVVIVSHDKYLLDRMIDTVAALEKGTIREYQGNYSQYLTEKEGIREVQLSTFKNQQKKIQQTERFIERFRYKNTKAKQVQSRIKMLEKLDVIEEPEQEQKRIKLKFPEAPRSGRVVFEMSEFSKSYGTGTDNMNVVFEDACALKIERGDKIAIAGKNGEGKTTLAKMIVGKEKFNGESKLGHNVELAYYAQNQADNLSLEKTVYEEFLNSAPNFSDTQIRSILGSFLFDEDDLEKKVKVLSGGEKSRVSLSKMLASPSNFLVLDEPTNHLDIQSREILLAALKNYTGSFLVISHDRYFIDQLVNKVWYVEGKTVETHLGNYSDLLNRSKPKKPEITEEKISDDVKQVLSKENKKETAERRNSLFRELKEFGIENMQNWKELSKNQLANAMSELEEKIVKTEAEKEKYEKLLNDPELFKDKEKAEQKTNDLYELDMKLKAMYKRWDEVADYIDIK